MMWSMRTTTFICLVFLTFVAPLAQDDIAEEEQEIRRYMVEMIIFKYAQEVAPGSEIFPADKPVIPDPVLDDESLLLDSRCCLKKSRSKRFRDDCATSS